MKSAIIFFIQKMIKLLFSKDTPVGTQIMRISATDVDEGDNQKIAYDLISTGTPSDIEFFRWVDVVRHLMTCFC